MRKQEFLEALRKRLSRLPGQDVEERLDFYSEMIDDRMEEGRDEAEAVAEIGSVDEVAKQILSEIPLSRIAKERFKPQKRLQTWEIVLLAVGSPIWISLAASALVVILSLCAALWSVVISLWAVFASLAGCALGGLIAGIVFAAGGNGTVGLAMMGAALVCAGLSVLAFFGCKEATRGTALLAKQIALGIKKCFVGKERNQ